MLCNDDVAAIPSDEEERRAFFAAVKNVLISYQMFYMLNISY